MDTALTIRQVSLDNMMTLAEAFARSGFFKDANDAAKAIVKIQAGRELGIPPVAAMTGINIVQGKINLSANVLASLVKRHPSYNYAIEELDDTMCEISFFENGNISGVSTFTMEDAAKAGLANGTNWTKYPRNMLFARAISNGVKWYCPDVMGGAPVYTPDEMGQEVDGGGGLRLWASSEQLDYIRGRLEALFPDMTFANDGHYNYMLKRNGYPRLDELTGERAAELIDQLSQDPGADEAAYDANGVDEVTAEDTVALVNEHTDEIIGYAGSEPDADAYEDAQEQVGRNVNEIVPTNWRELYEHAEAQYGIKENPHVVNIVRKTYPDFTKRGKEQPTVIEAWNAFVTYEQSKQANGETEQVAG